MKPSSQTHYRTLTEIEKKGLLNSTEWHGFGEPTQRLSSLEFSKGIGKGSCQFTNARNEAITEWIRMWPSLNCSLISNLITSRYSAQCCVSNIRRDNSVNKIRIWWNGKVGFYRRDVSIHFFFCFILLNISCHGDKCRSTLYWYDMKIISCNKNAPSKHLWTSNR